MADAYSESSSCRVLTTTELLENILLFLDLRTLLLAQRTSKHFRDVIIGSTRIQQALFLKPLSTVSDADIEVFQAHKSVPRTVHSKGHLPRGWSTATPINPLLDRYLQHGFTLDIAMTTIDQPRSVVLTPSQARRDTLSKHLSHPTASFRNMLVIQPHAGTMFMRDFKPGESPLPEHEYISLRHGLTMGRVLEGEMGKEDHLPADYYRHRWELPLGLRWTLGRYDDLKIPHQDREAVIGEICGWDVLSPDYGKQLATHPRYVEKIERAQRGLWERRKGFARAE